MTKLLIIGGGGHAKVVADVALSMRHWESLIFVDDRYPVLKQVLGFPVLGRSADLQEIIVKENIKEAFVAIGNNLRRLSLLDQCRKFGLAIPNLIHPSAIISPFAKLGEGILIMPQTVINCAANLGSGCIINTAAIIEHDCILSDGVHISPNAALAGGVQIGHGSWVGIGSSIKEQIKIGENVIIGAGSVVIRDVRDNCTIAGVPASFIKNNQPQNSEENE